MNSGSKTPQIIDVVHVVRPTSVYHVLTWDGTGLLRKARTTSHRQASGGVRSTRSDSVPRTTSSGEETLTTWLAEHEQTIAEQIDSLNPKGPSTG